MKGFFFKQGSALRKKIKEPMLWTCEMQGAQHMISKQKLRFPGSCTTLFLLLLLLSLLSQSLLVFFLCISRAQTMHLRRQSLKSIILFMHWGTFLRIHADPSTQIFWISVIVALSDTYYYYYYYYYYYHYHYFLSNRKFIFKNKANKETWQIHWNRTHHLRRRTYSRREGLFKVALLDFLGLIPPQFER